MFNPIHPLLTKKYELTNGANKYTQYNDHGFAVLSFNQEYVSNKCKKIKYKLVLLVVMDNLHFCHHF